MNAGKGKKSKSCISDYLDFVDVLQDGKVRRFQKSDCRFSYRSSVFQHSDIIILGAQFTFPAMEKETTEQLRKDRMAYVEEHQDTSKPNFGSLFMKGSPKEYRILKKHQFGFKRGVHFSGKSNNWLLNEGNGTYREEVFVIRVAKFLHKITRHKQKLEVVIWD